MRVVQRFACHFCNRTIEPERGFIIQGNIYLIRKDIEDRADIIGNSFPYVDNDGKISIEDIEEVAYHNHCLLDLLNEACQEELLTNL